MSCCFPAFQHDIDLAIHRNIYLSWKKFTSSFLTINGYQSLKSRRKYWQPYTYSWQLSSEWILRYQKTTWKKQKRNKWSSFALIWLPTNEATLFQFRGTVNNVHKRYSGQKAWCLRIEALHLYVIVFSLNCKISDILPEINGAQVGYTLKDINAGRNSSRDTA